MFRTVGCMVLVILAVTFIGQGVNPAELTVGMRGEPNLDPHFLYLMTHLSYYAHFYGKLVDQDDKMRVVPDLAVSWKTLDETTWEYRLRRGVKFHDGSDFTAEDVVFSIKRIPTILNSPNPYTGHIRSIVGMEVVDPYTIRFKTDRPDPLLPANLSRVVIVSRKAAEGATTADFNSGKAAIGTGPYKLVQFTPGDRLVLARNDQYWGTKPYWDRITFRMISNDSARVASLLGGDVDMIEYVPPTEAPSLEKNKNSNGPRPE